MADPTKDDPRYDNVKIDLDAEVMKLAQRDGVTKVQDLQLKVAVRVYDRYADTIRAFYQGKDQGYAEGVLFIGRPYTRRVRLFLSIGIVLGTLLGSLLTTLVFRTILKAS